METPSKQHEISSMNHEEEKEMQHDMSKLWEQVQQISLAQKVTEAKMDGVKKDVEAQMYGVEAKMDGLKKGIEAKMNDVETKMDGVETKMDDLKKGMKTKMEYLTKILQEILTNC